MPNSYNGSINDSDSFGRGSIPWFGANSKSNMYFTIDKTFAPKDVGLAAAII